MIPIIKVEIEYLREAITHAFMERHIKWQEILNAAVDEAITEERLLLKIRQAADRIIKDLIEQEVEAFFLTGAGRKVIRKAVLEKLKEEIPNG